MSEEERREFREWMGRPVRALVRDAARAEDPTELELLAARLVPPVLLQDGPPGAVAELVAVVAETKGGRSLLRALSAAAPPPVSTLAGEALAGLGEGPLTIAAQRAGTLAPERALVLDADEPVTSVMFRCRRPGGDECFVLGFTFEWPATGGAITDAFAATMLPETELEETLLEPTRTQGIEISEIPVADAVERVAQGARRCVRVGFGPDREALPAVTLLLRASRPADADELIAPLICLPALADLLDGGLDEELDEDEPERDEEALRAELDRLAAALDDWCANQYFDEELGGLDATPATPWPTSAPSMSMEIHWSPVDLGEYLLDFVPRKVGLDDAHLARFPQAVTEVLRFLGESGRLDPRTGELLTAAATSVSERFVDRASDPRNFGPAKAITHVMLADGVDLSDQRAIDGWIAAYHSLPEQERHRRAPALARPAFPTAPSTTPSQAATSNRKTQAKTRKAQRQARRRNRRN